MHNTIKATLAEYFCHYVGNVAFHRADPADWTGEAPYDVLVSCYGVFLLDDMDTDMDRLVRLLAPGGRCAVSAWDEGALEPFGQLLLDSIVASTALVSAPV